MAKEVKPKAKAAAPKKAAASAAPKKAAAPKAAKAAPKAPPKAVTKTVIKAVVKAAGQGPQPLRLTPRPLGGFLLLRVRPEGAAGKKISAALEKVMGLPLPGPRAFLTGTQGRAVAWASPDEFWLFLPQASLAAAQKALAAALAGVPHLLADMSEARTGFLLEGAGAEAALSRLTPTDFARFPEGELRRTRLAQVACGYWREGAGFALLVFRSVAPYAEALLENAAAAARADLAAGRA